MTCDECGATFASEGESCTTRFDVLLALDHSWQEPWGSRHGLAFAVFAVQHPIRHDGRTVARAFELLTRVVRNREPLVGVVRDFRARDAHRSRDFVEGSAPLPRRASIEPFRITIADLGDFAAEEYPAQLDAWCRATLDALVK